MVMAALLIAATAQVLAPPAPPLPRNGHIECDLRDREGVAVHLNGMLGLSEPRVGGRRFPQVTFTADSVAALAGTYEAQWTIRSGDFIRYSNELRLGITMKLLAYTFGNQSGAMVAEVRPNLGGVPRFFAGFCQMSFSSEIGGDHQ